MRQIWTEGETNVSTFNFIEWGYKNFTDIHITLYVVLKN